MKRKILFRDDIQKQCHLQVQDEFKERYLDILYKHQDALSIYKYNLGLAKNFKNKIHLPGTKEAISSIFLPLIPFNQTFSTYR